MRAPSAIRWATATLLLLASSASQAQTVLHLSHTDQKEGGRHAAALLFANKLESVSQGRLTVEVHCCGTRGNDAKNIEQVIAGNLDMTLSATGSYAAQLPTLNLMMMPYLVDDLLQGWKLYDTSQWLKAQWDKAPAKGLRHLATWEAGFRQMTTRTPLLQPADARGKTIRTFPNEMMRWTLETLGFKVQILPLGEVYAAIQKGTVDGQENPTDTISSNRFYEVAPHVTLTRHVYSPIPLTVSEKTWQKLSPADQAALLEAAQGIARYSRLYVVSQEERQIADMTARGAKIHQADIAAFRQAVQPVYLKARERYGADVETLLAEAAAVRRATYRPLIGVTTTPGGKP